ncbi:MAG TPA: hypothetical protein VNZ57_02870 [Longimicrobiales bacterium]|nr:hypothetical protein [Longimicrobiales bacterium]
MSRSMAESVRAGAVLLVALALIVVAGEPARAQEAGGGAAGNTVLDGVYTAAQAEQGGTIFHSRCTLCHTLEEFVYGTHAPTAKFATIGDMFLRISTQMPMDNPGELSYQQYVAIISYILQQNGYPAGETELPIDIERLNQIRVVPLPADH